jgi:hypothetical protein
VGVSLGQQKADAQGRGEKGTVHGEAVWMVKRNIERDRAGRYLKNLGPPVKLSLRIRRLAAWP